MATSRPPKSTGQPDPEQDPVGFYHHAVPRIRLEFTRETYPLRHAHRAGGWLVTIQEQQIYRQCGHDEWLAFLDKELQVSESTALRMMKLARGFYYSEVRAARLSRAGALQIADLLATAGHVKGDKRDRRFVAKALRKKSRKEAVALCQEALGVDKPKPAAPAKPKKPARERTMSALVSTLAGVLLRAGVAAKLVTDRQGELCTVPEEGRLQLLRALLLNSTSRQ